MHKNWCELRIGDQIRITHIPEEWNEPGYRFPDDTRRLYNHLIRNRAVLTVDWMDDWGIPWVSYEWEQADGKIEYHSLAVDDTSWELVKAAAFVPPGHHSLDQPSGTDEPVDYQLEQLSMCLKRNQSHFASLKVVRESRPEDAKRELQLLEETIKQSCQHLERLTELLRAGYRPTIEC